LKIELFSARLETDPSEAVKLNVLPLNRELAGLREPDRDLKIEDFSTRLDAEPSEPVKALARPLT
jgi:hypothetical protein